MPWTESKKVTDLREVTSLDTDSLTFEVVLMFDGKGDWRTQASIPRNTFT